MSDLKISQLPNAYILQDSDLIPVVQTSGTELVTTKTTVSSLRSASSSSSTLFYPGAGKAIEASGSDLYIYDRNGSTISRLNPTKLTIAHNQVDINIQTSKPGEYESDLKLNEMGLRYTRLEKINGIVSQASQIRLNSADGYFNAKENVEIAAGTIGNEPNDVTLNNLSGGTLRMISGSKTFILSKGPINIEPAKNLILKTPEAISIEGKRCDIVTTGQINLKSTTDSFKFESKNLTIDTTGQVNINNNNSGTLIKTTGASGTGDIYVNTASVKKDGIKLITETNNVITNQLSFSNSAASLKSTQVTFEANNFVVKDINGNMVYDNGIITGLITTINNLNNQISSLNTRVEALESYVNKLRPHMKA